MSSLSRIGAGAVMGVLAESDAVLPEMNELSVAAVVLLVVFALIVVGLLAWVALRRTTRRRRED